LKERGEIGEVAREDVVPIVTDNQKVTRLLKKLPDQMHRLELLGELHDDHHPMYDPPPRPQTFTEILAWFASESVPDTAFNSDTFDVHFEPSVSRQHSNTSPAGSPIPSRSVGFRHHCKSFFLI
jgi:hypothetical protein